MNRLVNYRAYREAYRLDPYYDHLGTRWRRRRPGRPPGSFRLGLLTPIGKMTIEACRSFIGWAEVKRQATKVGMTLRWEWGEEVQDFTRTRLKEVLPILHDRLLDLGVEMAWEFDAIYYTAAGELINQSSEPEEDWGIIISIPYVRVKLS